MTSQSEKKESVQDFLLPMYSDLWRSQRKRLASGAPESVMDRKVITQLAAIYSSPWEKALGRAALEAWSWAEGLRTESMRYRRSWPPLWPSRALEWVGDLLDAQQVRARGRRIARGRWDAWFPEKRRGRR